MVTHELAFALVSKICPDNAGMRWNTSVHTGCDTAWAVADQYEQCEILQAIEDLESLAGGNIPSGWEPAETPA